MAHQSLDSASPNPVRVIATGGAKGIGAEVVRSFAELGAEALIPTRDNLAAAHFAANLNARIGRRAITAAQLDLSNLRSIQAFADEQSDVPVDVLVNNAGVMELAHIRRRLSARPTERWPDALRLRIARSRSGIGWSSAGEDRRHAQSARDKWDGRRWNMSSLTGDTERPTRRCNRRIRSFFLQYCVGSTNLGFAGPKRSCPPMAQRHRAAPCGRRS